MHVQAFQGGHALRLHHSPLPLIPILVPVLDQLVRLEVLDVLQLLNLVSQVLFQKLLLVHVIQVQEVAEGGAPDKLL